MAPKTIDGIEEMQAAVGERIGPSDWREITQELIDSFAEVSGDHQWIHVDRERAERESPFGTTIAHGNLTLSIVDGFRPSLLVSKGFKLGVNYGWNKVRFPAPVPSGSRLRAWLEIDSVTDRGGGWYEIVTRFEVEIEGGDKPVCVAEHVGRVLPE